MSKTPNFDLKVKAVLDATLPGERVCALTGEKWMMDKEEIGWYRHFNVPPHPWAPRIRLLHLFGFASGASLWKKQRAITGEMIPTFVPPDSPFGVIPDREWFVAEFLRTGPELDPVQPFFKQIKALAYHTPIGALRDDGTNTRCIGVDMMKGEDNWMVFGNFHNKRCAHIMFMLESEDVCDAAHVTASRESWNIVRCEKMYRCVSCMESSECLHSSFLFDCRGCEFCYGASNQRYKKYLWWNEALSQAEWEKRRAEIDLCSRSTYDTERVKFEQMIEHSVWPERTFVGSEACDGEFAENSVRCHRGYNNWNSQDLYSCWNAEKYVQSAFSAWIGWGDNAYLCGDLSGGSHNKFCFRTWWSQSTEYCLNCYNCEYCFGCVGLRQKRYCIYNVQYNEASYWQKLDEIKCAMLERGEYGMFFPASLSEPGFEYSMGDMYGLFSDELIKKFDAPRFPPSKRGAEASAILPEAIPDRSDDPAADALVGRPIFDEECSRQYVIPAQELRLARSLGFPLPREHYLRRLKRLLTSCNVPVVEVVLCGSCGKNFDIHFNATWSSRRVIYCMPCYFGFLEKRG